MNIFFDTMIYLHYKQLDEICISDFLGKGPHRLFIPRITLTELDKHKNSHQSNRIRDRARKVLRKIEMWVNGTCIRPGFYAEFLPDVPTIDYAAHGLRADWADDVLLATVYELKNDKLSDSVVLVTQDTGLRLKACHLGISVRVMPDEYMLASEPDDNERENRELRAAIKKLQSALPKLSLVFAESEEDSQVASFWIGPSIPANEEEIQTRLAELRTEFPELPLFSNPCAGQGSSVPDIREAIAAISSFNSIGASEFERYNLEVGRYLSKYEEYLRGKHDFEDSVRRGIRFALRIQNSGTAPADDVDILIHFPDGFGLFSEDTLPAYPEEPAIPVKPRTQIEMINSMANRSFAELNYDMPKFSSDSSLETFRIERSNSYDVTDHYHRIKQGSYQDLPEMFLIFDSFETARSFNAKYSIQPANLPEPVEGDLHFEIKRNDEHSLPDV